MICIAFFFFFFFFNDTATTEIYTLSLPAALPISKASSLPDAAPPALPRQDRAATTARSDRKSTRLNSSHSQISYTEFRFKKQYRQMNPELTKREGGRNGPRCQRRGGA